MALIDNIRDAFLAVAGDVNALSKRHENDLPGLLASTRAYSEGSIVTTRAEGFSYEAVSADPDITTAGGVYLRARWRESGFDIRSMGAKCDGVTDDTQAFQRAVDRAVGEGVNVILPPGTIRLGGRVTLDLTGYTAETDEMGVSILGAGRGVTELVQGAAGAGITVLGSTTGAGAHHHSSISGIKFNGFGQALLLKNAAFMDISNVFVLNGDLAFKLEDVLSCRFTNVYTRFGKRGLFAQARQTFTNPNALSFYGCHFGKMDEYGAYFQRPAMVAFYGGSFEGNGADTSAPIRGAIRVAEAGIAGGIGLLSSGVYYEGNGGTADIHIVQGANACGYEIVGNVFNRVGTAALQTQRNIFLDVPSGSGRATLNTRNAYHDFGGYTPTASEPYIQVIDNANNAVWNDLGDTFTTLAAWPAASGGATRVCGVFDGTEATPSVNSDKNVASITKNATGDYTINFKHPVPTGNRFTYASLNMPGYAFVFGETNNMVRIRTQNAAGTLTDFTRISFTVGR